MNKGLGLFTGLLVGRKRSPLARGVVVCMLHMHGKRKRAIRPVGLMCNWAVLGLTGPVDSGLI